MNAFLLLACLQGRGGGVHGGGFVDVYGAWDFSRRPSLDRANAFLVTSLALSFDAVGR